MTLPLTGKIIDVYKRVENGIVINIDRPDKIIIDISIDRQSTPGHKKE